jgi:hypothetical protein
MYGNSPRMFFESNRQLSSFSMQCLANGSYLFNNVRTNWPTCLTGKGYYFNNKKLAYCILIKRLKKFCKNILVPL